MKIEDLIDGAAYRIQTHKGGMFIGYYNKAEMKFERNGAYVTLEYVEDLLDKGKYFEKYEPPALSEKAKK